MDGRELAVVVLLGAAALWLASRSSHGPPAPTNPKTHKPYTIEDIIGLKTLPDDITRDQVDDLIKKKMATSSDWHQRLASNFSDSTIDSYIIANAHKMENNPKYKQFAPLLESYMKKFHPDKAQ